MEVKIISKEDEKIILSKMIFINLMENLIKSLIWNQNINSKNKAYFQINKTNIYFLNHTTFLKNKFNLQVDENKKGLVGIYWIIKLLKNLSETRFIIVAPESPVKPIRKGVAIVLKLL